MLCLGQRFWEGAYWRDWMWEGGKVLFNCVTDYGKRVPL